MTFACLCLSGLFLVLTSVLMKLPQFHTLHKKYFPLHKGSVSQNVNEIPPLVNTKGTTVAARSLTEHVRSFCRGHIEEQSKKLADKNKTEVTALQGIYWTYKHLLYAVNPRNNRSVLYCSIPKVANTSLKTLLLSLNESHRGMYSDSNMHYYAYTKMGLPYALYRNDVNFTTLANAFKIMFVRHPFERLVSFFEDKTRRSVATGRYFYYKYWNAAMVKYRGVGNVDTTKDLITFEEFVDLLLSIEPSHYDLHWQLYAHRCEPCLVPYDFVGTLEDVPVMYHALGLPDGSQLWANKGPSDTKDMTLAYFTSLPKSKVERLCDIYALDFAMFNYSANEYLTVANDSMGGS